MSLLEHLGDGSVAAASPTAASILPLTAEEITASCSSEQNCFAGQRGLLLTAVAAVFLLSCMTAVLTYWHIVRVEMQRRRRLAAIAPLGLHGISLKKPNVEKAAPETDSPRAEPATKSAPETPEQIYTPKQDRRGSRDLGEVIFPSHHHRPNLIRAQMPMLQVIERLGVAIGAQETEEDEKVVAGAARRSSLSKEPLIEGRSPLSGPVKDGEQHYKWSDGSEYFGEWSKGLANGRGIFVYPSGVLL
jgi:hypothetical protein